ncbi:MAG: hypothetical protein MO852_06950, partial [Candidatus Devosia euplotis]|nr:hypothetical protein [Candidatus Devosia euplotis]
VGRRQRQTLELLIYRASPADAVALVERALDGVPTLAIDCIYAPEARQRGLPPTRRWAGYRQGAGNSLTNS